ncbi:MAG TPA: helix-turn-helix domain-containing protein [Chromatiales bacterium]|nr:helix-turn-helix domain-containing protein [Chromatiales bacterium]
MKVAAPAGLTAEALPPYLSVRQAAEYLQINEKKVYALLREGSIPATKVTGKWLFPRHLVDQWLLESTRGGVLTDRLLVTGSDDPLLHRLVHLLADELQEHAAVLYSPTGTRLGLGLLARRKANACVIHWGPAEESHRRHPALLRHHPPHKQWVLVRLYLREQGLILGRTLPADAPIEAALRPGRRWVLRQDGAGSQRFLEESLADHGLSIDQIEPVRRAYSEREAAAAIAMGEADLAPGVRAAATEFGLGFLPLGWEAFDLVLYRDVYFRTLFQRLLQLLRQPRVRALAATLEGYAFDESATLVWNG